MKISGNETINEEVLRQNNIDSRDMSHMYRI